MVLSIMAWDSCLAKVHSMYIVQSLIYLSLIYHKFVPESVNLEKSPIPNYKYWDNLNNYTTQTHIYNVSTYVHLFMHGTCKSNVHVIVKYQCCLCVHVYSKHFLSVILLIFINSAINPKHFFEISMHSRELTI